jgi:hypothetical protein
MLRRMKTNMKLFLATLTLGYVAAIGSSGAAAAEPMTAFQLVKEGNRFIGEQSKDKLVQIRSEKSIGSLQPNIWWIVYFDTTASMKAVEVKFGGGQMMEVKRPFRLLERAFAEDKIFDRDKLKIDSDKAIDIAKKQPLLENLTLKATRLQLDRWEGTTTWKVRLYAAKLSSPNKDVDIGEVFVSADEGKILKTDLHINRVD